MKIIEREVTFVSIQREVEEAKVYKGEKKSIQVQRRLRLLKISRINFFK
jgi:hypothetical protein